MYICTSGCVDLVKRDSDYLFPPSDLSQKARNDQDDVLLLPKLVQYRLTLSHGLGWCQGVSKLVRPSL
jgi:hypothetical protein